MSNGFEKPLVIPLRFDRRLTWANHLAHLASVVVLGFVDVPNWSLAMTMCGLIASHRYCSSRHVHRKHPEAIVRLVLESDGTWTLHRRCATPLYNAHLESYFVSADWVVVRYVANGWSGRSVIISATSTEPAAFRRLKFLLRASRPVKFET